MNDLNITEESFVLQDIKSEAITEKQLDEMKALSGSYESLFSRTAQKYKELALKGKDISEEEYKAFILEFYTFLKRPVCIVDGQIFIGNSKKNIAALADHLGVQV